jgi:hypothetical protein
MAEQPAQLGQWHVTAVAGERNDRTARQPWRSSQERIALKGCDDMRPMTRIYPRSGGVTSGRSCLWCEEKRADGRAGPRGSRHAGSGRGDRRARLRGRGQGGWAAPWIIILVILILVMLSCSLQNILSWSLNLRTVSRAWLLNHFWKSVFVFNQRFKASV